ncbi:unnamed protein product [Cylicostephanus goldi]|uniref:EGF-like domain-containing protein n=1 Tax=Cylicostephanus goldi TaxID=71465 RepID=A0A3P6RXM4_CYLGO|nr:unnamed protein product [Cylicostephanus goldi]
MLCKSKCNGDISEDCGNAKHALVYIYDTVVQDPNACDNRTLCNADLDHGVCVDMAPDSNNFLCKCNPQYTGTNCETRISGPCDSNPCLNDGVCKPDYVLKTYTCECVAGYSGKKCEYAPQCGTNPCLHGGTCVENYDGTYKCNCLEFYNGKNCEEIDTCAYNDKCVNGTCNSIANGVVPGSTCTCIPGYTGVFCDESLVNER